MGHCFEDSLLLSEEDNVEGQVVHLRLGVEAKCWMMKKLNILVFKFFFFGFSMQDIVKNFGEKCLKIGVIMVMLMNTS